MHGTTMKNRIHQLVFINISLFDLPLQHNYQGESCSLESISVASEQPAVAQQSR